MKLFQKILLILNFVQIGACLLRAFAIYNDFTRHPDLYATYSAPWYTGILVTAAVTAVMVLVTLTTYFIVGHIVRRCRDRR